MDNHSLVAKENRSGAGNLVVCGEALRSGDRFVAVVPDNGDRTTAFRGGELERYLRGRGGSEGGRCQNIIEYLRAEGFRGNPGKRPERREEKNTKTNPHGGGFRKAPRPPNTKH